MKHLMLPANGSKLLTRATPCTAILIFADNQGNIVACSKLELRNELSKLNVSDHEWFQLGMRTGTSNDYAVQDVCDSPLERTQDTSLVYVGGVRAGGARKGEAIGVLGICFDWDTEAGTILQKTCYQKGPTVSSYREVLRFIPVKVVKLLKPPMPSYSPLARRPTCHLHTATSKSEQASQVSSHSRNANIVLVLPAPKAIANTKASHGAPILSDRLKPKPA